MKKDEIQQFEKLYYYKLAANELHWHEVVKILVGVSARELRTNWTDTSNLPHLQKNAKMKSVP
jgi:hypothetical protein